MILHFFETILSHYIRRFELMKLGQNSNDTQTAVYNIYNSRAVKNLELLSF